MQATTARHILVISVHPDDETLGCGGTMLKHRAAGDVLYWLVITAPHVPDYSEETLTRAAAQVAAVAAQYDVTRYWRLGLPTTRLDSVPQNELIAGIRDVLDLVHPDTVYLVNASDVHTDHHATFTAALSVLKPFHMAKWGVRRILSYETLSSTDAAPPQYVPPFVPNVFVDITPFLEQKLEIMRAYATEQQADLLPRGGSAIRALARYRGSAIGVEYAEAFMLIRERIE